MTPTAPNYRAYRKPPAFRVGALIRLQDGSIARIKTIDPKTDKVELGPAPRWLIAIRRALGKWDRREPHLALGGEMVKGKAYVSSSVKDVGGVDPLVTPAFPREYPAEFLGTPGEVACRHGLAMDLHCCACRRSGFFPPDDCTCGLPLMHVESDGMYENGRLISAPAVRAATPFQRQANALFFDIQQRIDADLFGDGRDARESKGWVSRLLCKLNLHDWRDGPGEPCTECGLHDWIFCPCNTCTRRREKR